MGSVGGRGAKGVKGGREVRGGSGAGREWGQWGQGGQRGQRGPRGQRGSGVRGGKRGQRGQGVTKVSGVRQFSGAGTQNSLWGHLDPLVGSPPPPLLGSLPRVSGSTFGVSTPRSPLQSLGSSPPGPLLGSPPRGRFLGSPPIFCSPSSSAVWECWGSKGLCPFPSRCPTATHGREELSRSCGAGGVSGTHRCGAGGGEAWGCQGDPQMWGRRGASLGSHPAVGLWLRGGGTQNPRPIDVGHASPSPPPSAPHPGLLTHHPTPPGTPSPPPGSPHPPPGSRCGCRRG